MSKSQLFYTSQQAGRLLGVSADTIRRWVREGRLAGELTPGGQVRIPQSEVLRYRSERPLAPRALPAGHRIRPGSEVARLAEQLEAERLHWKLERLQQRRARQAEEAQAAELLRQEERARAEREQQEREDAERRARRRAARIERCRSRLNSRVARLAPEARLAAAEVLEQRLARMDPLPEEEELVALVDAIAQAAAIPQRVEEENRQIMARLIGEHWELGRGERYAALRDEAQVRMHEALTRLGVEAAKEVREAAARQAFWPVLER